LLYKPLRALEGVNKQRAELYSEEFRLALLRAGRFRLIEIDDQNLTDKEIVVERNADLLLQGSVSLLDAKYRIYIQLNDDSGNTLLATTINTDEKNRDVDLTSLAEEVSLTTSFSGEGADAWIQAYIDTNQWERAWTAWSRRAETKPREEWDESFTYQGKLIRSKLAVLKADEAKKLLAGGYYDLARAAADEAAALEPENSEYRNLAGEIEGIQTRYNETSLVTQLGIVENLLQNKDYPGSLKMCTLISGEGFSDPRLDMAALRAEQLKIERVAWENAKQAYRKGEYDEALYSIDMALSVDPVFAEYIQLRNRIIRQTMLKEQTNRTVDNYRDNFASTDFRSMTLVRKDPAHIENLSVGYMKISGFDPSDGFQEQAYEFAVWGLSYTWYLKNLPDFLQFRNPAFALRPTFIGTFRIGGDYDGSPTGGPVPGYSESRFFFSEAAGTAGVSLQFFGFSLGTGFFFSLGCMSISDKVEYPTDPASNSENSNGAFILGTAWDIWLG
jgi:tetratricopeptide (TPR) repeat protein